MAGVRAPQQRPERASWRALAQHAFLVLPGLRHHCCGHLRCLLGNLAARLERGCALYAARVRLATARLPLQCRRSGLLWQARCARVSVSSRPLQAGAPGSDCCCKLWRKGDVAHVSEPMQHHNLDRVETSSGWQMLCTPAQWSTAAPGCSPGQSPLPPHHCGLESSAATRATAAAAPAAAARLGAPPALPANADLPPLPTRAPASGGGVARCALCEAASAPALTFALELGLAARLPGEAGCTEVVQRGPLPRRARTPHGLCSAAAASVRLVLFAVVAAFVVAVPAGCA